MQGYLFVDFLLICKKSLKKLLRKTVIYSIIIEHYKSFPPSFTEFGKTFCTKLVV